MKISKWIYKIFYCSLFRHGLVNFVNESGKWCIMYDKEFK